MLASDTREARLCVTQNSSFNIGTPYVANPKIISAIAGAHSSRLEVNIAIIDGPIVIHRPG
jgi:hypothetical protein